MNTQAKFFELSRQSAISLLVVVVLLPSFGTSAEIASIRGSHLEITSIGVDRGVPLGIVDKVSLSHQREKPAERLQQCVSLVHTSAKKLELFPSSTAMTSDYLWAIIPGRGHTSSFQHDLRYHLVRIDRDLLRPGAGLREFDPPLIRLEGGAGFARREANQALSPAIARQPGRGVGYLCVDELSAQLADKAHPFRSEREADAARPKAAMSLVPLGKQRCRMYVVSEPTTVEHGIWAASNERSWFVLDYEFGAEPELPRNPPEELVQHRWVGTWSLRAKGTADFVERFTAVPGASGDYLVTDSGRMFFLAWNDSRPATEMREIRLRNGALIQAVVIDADHGKRAFAFTADFYFELKEKLDYVDFALGPLSRIDPLPTLVRCAKAVGGDSVSKSP